MLDVQMSTRLNTLKTVSWHSVVIIYIAPLLSSMSYVSHRLKSSKRRF